MMFVLGLLSLNSPMLGNIGLINLTVLTMYSHILVTLNVLVSIADGGSDVTVDNICRQNIFPDNQRTVGQPD